jgi:ribosomal-protein-alanine N-acetyltransferase
MNADTVFETSREEWGRGYATEASFALIEHGFNDLHLGEIIAAINPQNVASLRVAR